jgi:hypothetical protein
MKFMKRTAEYDLDYKINYDILELKVDPVENKL